MSEIVEVPDELKKRLHQWAEEAHLPTEDVVRRALAAFLAMPPDLHDELEAWQQLGAEALERVAPIENETW